MNLFIFFLFVCAGQMHPSLNQFEWPFFTVKKNKTLKLRRSKLKNWETTNLYLNVEIKKKN
jgi:hypothetical protein